MKDAADFDGMCLYLIACHFLPSKEEALFFPMCGFPFRCVHDVVRDIVALTHVTKNGSNCSSFAENLSRELARLVDPTSKAENISSKKDNIHLDTKKTEIVPLCRELRLSTKGSKIQLVDRIQNHVDKQDPRDSRTHLRRSTLNAAKKFYQDFARTSQRDPHGAALAHGLQKASVERARDKTLTRNEATRSICRVFGVCSHAALTAMRDAVIRIRGDKLRFALDTIRPGLGREVDERSNQMFRSYVRGENHLPLMQVAEMIETVEMLYAYDCMVMDEDQ